MATVERLYELYNIISDAKDDACKHEAEYEEILTGAKAGSSERRLASQFIAKFFHHFPDQQEAALNYQFDLCEDSDITIRKQAIKDLPLLCKAKKQIIPKVSDILAQLIQMEDQTEVSAIHNSLTSLFKLDAKETLVGLFSQIENSEEELVRERCMKFILSKLVSLGPEIFKSDSEELIINESKAVLQDASEEEFILMMGILKELKATKSLKGYQRMVDVVEEQCDLSQSIDPHDLENIHRLSICLKHAVPYFSSVTRSTKFVDYLCREILPYINQLETNDETTEEGNSLTLDLLRTLAELLPHAGELEDTEGKVVIIFSKLLELMPLPPEGEELAMSLLEGASLEFSRVECLLYCFHQLARNHTEFLSANPERLKDFRVRLQYFSRASQAYQKRLRESIVDKKPKELKTKENNIKMVALKTTANINSLIKDLFHQPPAYKSAVTLSWKIDGKRSESEKRHTPITFETSPNKSLRTERQIYAPPRDKYSRGAGQFERGSGGRGGSRGYRGGRYNRGNRY